MTIQFQGLLVILDTLQVLLLINVQRPQRRFNAGTERGYNLKIGSGRLFPFALAFESFRPSDQ